jgi:hypothetical protein
MRVVETHLYITTLEAEASLPTLGRLTFLESAGIVAGSTSSATFAIRSAHLHVRYAVIGCSEHLDDNN